MHVCVVVFVCVEKRGSKKRRQKIFSKPDQLGELTVRPEGIIDKNNFSLLNFFDTYSRVIIYYGNNSNSNSYKIVFISFRFDILYAFGTNK